MKDTPIWMPFYVADYLKDTTHLNATQHGIYTLLIFHTWCCAGRITSNPKKLAKICRMQQREWNKHAPEVLELFQIDGDGYRHKRVDIELERAHYLVEQRRAAGAASAQKRALKKSNERSTSVATAVDTSDAFSLQRDVNQSQSQSQSLIPLSKDNGSIELFEQPTQPPDMDKIFWDSAKAYLGKSKASLIGKWIAKYGKSETFAAIAAAQSERAVEPVAFIEGVLRKSGHDNEPHDYGWGQTMPC